MITNFLENFFIPNWRIFGKIETSISLMKKIE